MLTISSADLSGSYFATSYGAIVEVPIGVAGSFPVGSPVTIDGCALVVRSVVRWPAGEPVAWVTLARRSAATAPVSRGKRVSSSPEAIRARQLAEIEARPGRGWENRRPV